MTTTPAKEREPTEAGGETASRPGTLTRAKRRLRRIARTAVYSARRRRLARLKRGARAGNVMLLEMADAELALPVHTAATHPEPELLPVALIVVTSEDADPASITGAVAARAQVTGTFRAALLAPPSWEPLASAHHLAVETLLPRSAWNDLHGSGWVEYLRQRITEACEVIHPVTVVQLVSGDNEDVDAALAACEAARTRRRL